MPHYLSPIEMEGLQNFLAQPLYAYSRGDYLVLISLLARYLLQRLEEV